MKLQTISSRLTKKVDQLAFKAPVTHVYNPLDYARRSHNQYLKQYGDGDKQVLLLGMNPGPFGMAQTGVPFGDVAMVRDWMGIKARVDRPADENPKRPIDGFDCPRSEVSGTRLWGWAKQRFKKPERFFSQFFVWNYCPLVFMEQSGRNRTPDKLPPKERDPLFEACDWALDQVIKTLKPHTAIGVGKFAEGRLKVVINNDSITIGTILHPSPASPAANRGWAKAAEKGLRDLGVKLS